MPTQKLETEMLTLWPILSMKRLQVKKDFWLRTLELMEVRYTDRIFFPWNSLIEGDEGLHWSKLKAVEHSA